MQVEVPVGAADYSCPSEAAITTADSHGYSGQGNSKRCCLHEDRAERTGTMKARYHKAAAVLFIAALLACSAGCRFTSEKYWGMPATYGLAHAMEIGDMPDGWVYLYPFTAAFDIILLPFTSIHDMIIALLNPPTRFKWEEQKEVRQMLYGY